MQKRGQVGQETLQAIRSAGYNDEEIIEILAHVALNTNYFNATIQTDIDFPVVSTRNTRNAA